MLGNTRFNDIAPSPSGHGSEYHLTPAGKDLQPVLGRWPVRWLYDEFRDDVEATTLMWWMHRRVDQERLPPSRVVVQFDHRSRPRSRCGWSSIPVKPRSACSTRARSRISSSGPRRRPLLGC